MKFNAKMNGRPFVLEIEDEELKKFRASLLTPPAQLNLKDAALYLGVSRWTVRRLGIPKNENGFYSVEELDRRAKASSNVNHAP